MCAAMRSCNMTYRRGWWPWAMALVVVSMQLQQLRYGNEMMSTVEAQYSLEAEDISALRAVHSWLQDAADAKGAAAAFFSTWSFEDDPCSFEGVLCDVVEGEERVAALNLGIASGSSRGLRGKLHPALGSLSALVQLTLAPGKVSGAIPSTLAKLSNLQYVGLSHNLLTGSIPPGLARLSQLACLDLGFNRLSGAIPKEVAALPNLRTLRLAHNRLTGTLPASFRASALLEHLDLERNSVSGPLPLLPASLTYLNLARNELSGELDNLQATALPHLSFLDLSQNQLCGHFPMQLLDSSAGAGLTFLSVRHNSLSGPVSPLQLVVIPTLDLSFNQFSGPVSPFFAFTRNLYLNNNAFTGGVPQEFIDQLLSSSMQTLYLQHNFLTNFPLASASSLPLTASVCVQYNCMAQLSPSFDSPCPHSRPGKRLNVRPVTQCKNA